METSALTLDYFAQRSVVEPDTGCWVWRLSSSLGYGRTYVRRSVTTVAHRLAYLVVHGSIPEGLTIDHLCGRTLCVNPAHLEAVTQFVNNRRAAGVRSTLNAAKTHCDNGHEFTPENTRTGPVSGRRFPRRWCRACDRAATARYRQRKRD